MGPTRPKAGVETAPGRAPNAFDSKLDCILRRAAEVFCERGYDRATIRDISRATGVSLAGLYYYFSSKNQLLYHIQRHAFETILDQARAALDPLEEPEARLRALVALHLKYFIEHPNEMKVLTHEESALGPEGRREVHALKKSYYRIGEAIVDEIRRTRRLGGVNVRVAVLSLFGMMNWIYTWYNPRVDPDAAEMASKMSAIFLSGLCGLRGARGRTKRARSGPRSSIPRGQAPWLIGRGPNGAASSRAARMRG